GRDPRRLFTHTPDDAIQSRTLARRQLIHQPARSIQYLYLELAEKMAGPLVVSDYSGLRRIVADKRGGAVRPPAASFDALLNRSRGNKARFLLQQISGERAQRRNVIDNPDAAAMRPEDE